MYIYCIHIYDIYMLVSFFVWFLMTNIWCLLTTICRQHEFAAYQGHLSICFLSQMFGVFWQLTLISKDFQNRHQQIKVSGQETPNICDKKPNIYGKTPTQDSTQCIVLRMTTLICSLSRSFVRIDNSCSWHFYMMRIIKAIAIYMIRL